MEHVDHEALLWLLAAGVAALGLLAAAAQRTRIPYPIFLLLAGVGLGFLPITPEIRLDPDFVFVLFLPPLIYSAAYFTSLREFKANMRHISRLAIGLVFATVLTVAVAAHTVIDGMSWPVAFVLGAIVSPTDPVAGSAVLERLRIPRRVSHIVEGESLINDGSGIVLYRVAVAAVVTGSFSLVHATVEFFVSCFGGVVIGLAAGVAVLFVRRRNEHGPTDVLLSVLSGYVAYLPAEALHVSGVLATATVGVLLGWKTPSIVRDPETRLQIGGLWSNATFVLNAILFLVVGMQMPWIVERIDHKGSGTLLGYATVVGATVIVTRLVWVFVATFLPRLYSRRERERDPNVGWRGPLLVGWIGMRGAVSLAAALALPTNIDGGDPFPQRDLVVFLAFAVIAMTLLVQGLTLGRLVRLLGVDGDDASFRRAEVVARLGIARAAVEFIDGPLAEEEWFPDDSRERMRRLHEYRTRRFEASKHDSGDRDEYEERARNWVRASRGVAAAQRDALLDMRRSGTISDEVVQHVLHELDHEELHVRA